jgi:quercetin dioxygenase-like cupin family protein
VDGSYSCSCGPPVDGFRCRERYGDEAKILPVKDLPRTREVPAVKGGELRVQTNARLLLPAVMMLAVLLSAVWSTDGAQQPGTSTPTLPAPPGNCPGKEGPTQYTGDTESRPVPSAVVNGRPMAGTYSKPNARSYWHCHPGGQFLIVMEGVGRAQKRGERMRDLNVGDIEYAGPWVEHWHGAPPNSATQFIQVALQPTGTRWMEEVSTDDYLGNDVGIKSRTLFLASSKPATERR